MGPWVTGSWGAEGPRYLLDDEKEEKGEGKEGPREDAELQNKAQNRLRLASPPGDSRSRRWGTGSARRWPWPGPGSARGQDSHPVMTEKPKSPASGAWARGP